MDALAHTQASKLALRGKGRAEESHFVSGFITDGG
jgi:hypothetical protein